MDLKGDLIDAFGQLMHRMILFETPPGFFAHPDSLVWISPEMQDGPPHTFRVTWLDK